jgi:ATP adenylyltransferase
LPFAHAAARLDSRIWQDPSQAAIALKDRYRRLLESLRIVLPQDRDTRIPSAYNLLVTQAWMLVVPRRQECFEGISLNAMAFAGAMLVRDAEQLDALRQSGPMAALQHAAGTEVE